MLMKQRMTSFVLLHWFTLALHLFDMFNLSTMFLQTLPISGLVGLIRRHLVLLVMIRMEVASSWPDYLPTMSAAKTSKLSLLVKHHILAIDEAS